MQKLVVMGVLLGLLSACSSYTSRGEQLYVSSHNGPHLVVPPPLGSENINHFYDLPAQNQNVKVDINPPDSAVIHEGN